MRTLSEGRAGCPCLVIFWPVGPSIGLTWGWDIPVCRWKAPVDAHYCAAAELLTRERGDGCLSPEKPRDRIGGPLVLLPRRLSKAWDRQGDMPMTLCHLGVFKHSGRLYPFSTPLLLPCPSPSDRLNSTLFVPPIVNNNNSKIIVNNFSSNLQRNTVGR